MKKLFTLLTLLVALVTNAWADDVIFSLTNVSVAADVSVAAGADYTITNTDATITGGTALVHNGKSSAAAMLTKSGKQVTIAGSGSSYFHVTLSDKTFAEGDIIKFGTVTGSGYIAKTTTKPSSTITITSDGFSIPEGSALIGQSELYFWKPSSGDVKAFTEFTITRPQPKTPVFSPTTGESVAAGSKITVTSQYSTSIQYKWTADNITPSDGWSDYDANAKITVPALADGTPYLHVQSVRSGVTGTTTGCAQYTITAPDTEAPTLSSTTPTDAATNVAVAGNIVLTFNENVACMTNATLTPAGGDAINLTPTVDGATVTYAYTGLAYSKAYTFNLAANSVEDLAGNKYASAISFGFTTIQETVATPTFTVYGNKVVKIECATAGDVKIYYGGSDVKTGSKTEYTGLFIPASNGTIYAYATKTGANDSEVASQAVTLPVVGNVVGNKLITLQPAATPANDTNYDNNTFTKSGYTLASTKALANSAINGYPCNFKAGVNSATITITPPSDATIKSIKIYGTSNDNSKVTAVTAGNGGSIISTPSELMVRNVIIGTDVVMSEVVMTIDSPSEGTAVSFTLGGTASQARFYVEVYGTTSATSESITPAKEYTTYVPNHDLDFTSHAKLTAYIATGATTSAVTVSSVNKVPAGTPIILKATETGSAITVPVAASTDDMTGNLLKAGDGTTSIGGNGKYDYVLNDGQFYHANAGTVAVGKAYLHLDATPADTLAPLLSIDFGGTTGINAVNGSELKVNGEYYNLNGQRVANPAKGLYIVNGKKVIIK